MRWEYDWYSSPRFPFRIYASAFKNRGSDADAALVITVECFLPDNGAPDRLIVSADITGEDGFIIAASPKMEIHVPPLGDLLLSRDGTGPTAHELVTAVDVLSSWLATQVPEVRNTLAAYR